MSARPYHSRLVAGVLLAMLVGCGTPRNETPAGESRGADAPAALQQVALPDLSRADRTLRERIQAAHSSLQAITDQGGSREVLGAAYGDLGKILMAAEFLSEAEPCFANAQTLLPSDVRWPYYLAHVHRLKNEPAKAGPLFERVLQLDPGHQPTLIWLGQLRVDEGRLDEADGLLQKALAVQPASGAARFGLGRAALARRQPADAVTHFEAALAADPQALAVHYPLAMAYRSLGNRQQAEAHLRQWKNVELVPADPLMEEIGGLLRTSLDYALRGTTALDRKNYAEAVRAFQKGLELSPRDPTLHLNLGTAFFLAGDGPMALTHFEEAVRLSPGYARANFALGVMMEELGRDAEAIDRFSAAVKYDGSLVDARFSLADALRRSGQPEASLPHYQALVLADPSASQARFGYAMALVRLRRYPEARAALEEAVKAHPDQVGFAHALARVLAAAPDDRIRDGRRALSIVETLRKSYRSVTLAETLAMAQAELGQFGQAIATQREAIAEASRAGQGSVSPQLTENLSLYERKLPCRTPWRDDDPVHRPKAASAFVR